MAMADVEEFQSRLYEMRSQIYSHNSNLMSPRTALLKRGLQPMVPVVYFFMVPTAILSLVLGLDSRVVVLCVGLATLAMFAAWTLSVYRSLRHMDRPIRYGQRMVDCLRSEIHSFRRSNLGVEWVVEEEELPDFDKDSRFFYVMLLGCTAAGGILIVVMCAVTYFLIEMEILHDQ